MANRRRTNWIDTTFYTLLASGSQSVRSLFSELSQRDVAGLTITRTIIDLGFSSTTVAGAWGTQRLSMGICLVSSEAFSAGVVPDPETEADLPVGGWLWRSTKLIAQNGAGAPVVFPLFIDLRSQRKVAAGELCFITSNVAGDGTSFSMRTAGLIRTLVRLP